MLLTEVDMTFSVLRELNALGVRLAIDDFGTGYSNLSYLKHFPVSKLKIDRSFVRDISTDSDDAAIVVAIIAMAKSLKLKVVAEGVENEAQALFLQRHECDQMQGYFHAVPMAADDLVHMHFSSESGGASVSSRGQRITHPEAPRAARRPQKPRGIKIFPTTQSK